MRRSGVADLPLHWGFAPRWLFERMVKLGRCISKIVILEYGRKEFLERLSDPFFFQSLSCVLGWDFHSSGATTVTCAALKEALNKENLGIAVLGGKGKASRKTPEEIENLAEKFSFSTRKIEELKYASRICAKVDNCVLQDGFQLYHHSFIVSEDGKFVVIQQGMNETKRYARRYHWFSEKIESFVNEPHSGIASDFVGKALNLVAKESKETRKACVDLVKDNPIHLRKYFACGILKYLKLPVKHRIEIKNYKGLMKALYLAYEKQPKDFEELIGIKGIGLKTIRALALLSKIIFGTEISWKDPVTFSFAHGGKDRTPYPVDRKTYDTSIKILTEVIEQAEIGKKEKMEALKRIEKVVEV